MGSDRFLTRKDYEASLGWSGHRSVTVVNKAIALIERV
jgi:hypothetical protein